MITEVSTDIFIAPIDILVHQCNCHHTMGAGIAKILSDKWPIVNEVDIKTTLKGDKTKLGTCSIATINDPNCRIKYVYNMYAQFRYGKGRYTNYEAFYRGLEFVKQHTANTALVIGFPYKIGCRSAGGSWRVVKTMIYDVFEDSPRQVLICQKPGEPD